jgi:hypothetical protein
MKTILKLKILVVLLGITLLPGCGGNDPSASEVMLKKLMAHPWELSNALVDGTDETTLYQGLVITFTKTGFTASNGGPIWPASGTWEFTDNKAKSIIRGDDLVVEIVEASKTTLKLSFIWDNNTFEPGRVSSVGGDHVFTFVE